MNINQNKNKRTPIPIPQPKGQPEPTREQYIEHPDFMRNFSEQMEGIVFPSDKIPVDFNVWLSRSLYYISFPSLKIPFKEYENITSLSLSQLSFGILQKCADIIFHSTPDEHKWLLVQHRQMLSEIIVMKNEMFDLIAPVREKVIDELVEQEKQKKNSAKLILPDKSIAKPII